jgi:hypothetical protein
MTEMQDHGSCRFATIIILRRGLAVWRLTAALVGCSALPIFQPATEFPNALVGPDGNEIHIATLEQIVNDEDLDDQQKRALLEELGIKDESIQDFILENMQTS